MQKVIANVNLKSIKDNAVAFKSLAKTKLCAVVKADAYGHGAERVAGALEREADMFAVAIADEGIAIRVAACGKPVLVLTPPVSADEAREIVRNGFIASVPDLFTARLVSDAARELGLRARVHLKVNTGMNRYGMNLSMLGKVCTFFRDDPAVLAEGLYSHLYTHDCSESVKQLCLFSKMQAVANRYFGRLCCHLSATYGSLLGDAFALDMVRVGLGLYGYLPVSEATFSDLPAYGKLPALKKAMRVRARITATRRYSFGGAGYRSETTEIPQKGEYLTVIRAGYADGFLRDGKKSGALITGGLNDLCMDAALKSGRGKRGGWAVVLADADESAKREQTISHEVLCAATRRAEFIYEYE